MYPFDIAQADRVRREQHQLRAQAMPIDAAPRRDRKRYAPAEPSAWQKVATTLRGHAWQALACILGGLAFCVALVLFMAVER